MKLTVTADRYQYILMDGSDVLGHYTTPLTLLEGARRHLRRSKTKHRQDLQDWIEKGIAHEAKVMKQLSELPIPERQ